MTDKIIDADIALNALKRDGPALNGKVLGLIGYGAVGREIARRAARCGMQVVYTDPVPGRGPHQRVLLIELLARSDFIMALTRAESDALLELDLRALMKPGARLVRPPGA